MLLSNSLSTSLSNSSRTVGRTIATAKAALISASLVALSAPAFAQSPVGNPAPSAASGGIGSRLTAASVDLGVGGGYVLELMGYILGAAAILAGFYTIWQYTKNPNGQNKLGYGIAGVILGGAFLSASLWGSFASSTVSGGSVTNTGAAQQLTF